MVVAGQLTYTKILKKIFKKMAAEDSDLEVVFDAKEEKKNKVYEVIDVISDEEISDKTKFKRSSSEEEIGGEKNGANERKKRKLSESEGSSSPVCSTCTPIYVLSSDSDEPDEPDEPDESDDQDESDESDDPNDLHESDDSVEVERKYKNRLSIIEELLKELEKKKSSKDSCTPTVDISDEEGADEEESKVGMYHLSLDLYLYLHAFFNSYDNRHYY